MIENLQHTVDRRNPANQLRLGLVYPFIPLFTGFLAPSQVVFSPSTVFSVSHSFPGWNRQFCLASVFEHRMLRALAVVDFHPMVVDVGGLQDAGC